MGKDAIYRSRNRLKQLHRIDYKERKGNLSAVYRIIPFVSAEPTQKSDCVGSADTKCDTTPTQIATQCRHKSQPLNKHKHNININQTKEINDVDGDAAGVRDEAGKLLTPEILFVDSFQAEPSPVESRGCEQLLGAYDPDLVEYAFERAAELGQKNLAYVRGILGRMKQRGIHDMGDLADWDMKAGEI